MWGKWPCTAEVPSISKCSTSFTRAALRVCYCWACPQGRLVLHKSPFQQPLGMLDVCCSCTNTMLLIAQHCIQTVITTASHAAHGYYSLVYRNLRAASAYASGPHLKEVLGLSEHVHDSYEAGGAGQTPDTVVIWILPPWQLKAAVPVRAGLCWGNMNELALHGTAPWEGACISVA